MLWSAVSTFQNPRKAGGLSPLSSNDPNLLQAISAVKHDIIGRNLNRYAIDKVLRAHSQVVAGRKYYVTLLMKPKRKSNTRNKNGPKNKFKITPKYLPRSKKICHAEIVVVPWMDLIELIRLECNNKTKKWILH